MIVIGQQNVCGSLGAAVRSRDGESTRQQTERIIVGDR